VDGIKRYGSPYWEVHLLHKLCIAQRISGVFVVFQTDRLTFSCRFKHRDDIFGGHTGQYAMDLLEHKPASRRLLVGTRLAGTRDGHLRGKHQSQTEHAVVVDVLRYGMSGGAAEVAGCGSYATPTDDLLSRT